MIESSPSSNPFSLVARHGHGRAAVVLGDAGIGKTALVETVAAVAREQGIVVCTGFASEDAAPPYWVWRSVLSLLELPDDVLGSGRDRDQAFADLVDALELSMTKPTLIALEDVHWADAASLKLLRVVIDAAPRLPLALVATARNDPSEVDPAIHALLASLPTAVLRVELSGLSQADSAEVAGAVMGSPIEPAVAAAVHDRTGGNPFFIREVARLMASRHDSASTVPTAVREVLSRRLGRLSEPCHALLGAAAVAGDDADVDLIATISGTTSGDALDTLAEAVSARLLAPVRHGQVRFAHALVREVTYDGIGASRRDRLHTAVVEQLTRSGAEPSRLAHHWSRVSGAAAEREAVTQIVAAAGKAMDGCGFEQAADWYAQALAHEDTARAAGLDLLRIELNRADALMAAARLEPARCAYASAATSASAQRRPREFAEAVLGLGSGVGGFEVLVADVPQLTLLEDALDLLPETETVLRAAVLARMSVASAELAPMDRRREQALAAVELAGETDDAHVQGCGVGGLLRRHRRAGPCQ